MSKFSSNQQFVTRCQDARILSLSISENKEEVFQAINGSRIVKDNSYKTKSSEERNTLKLMKKSVSNPKFTKKYKSICV